MHLVEVENIRRVVARSPMLQIFLLCRSSAKALQLKRHRDLTQYEVLVQDYPVLKCRILSRCCDEDKPFSVSWRANYMGEDSSTSTDLDQSTTLTLRGLH